MWPGNRKFIYNSEGMIFEIMDDFALRPCGKLDGFVDYKVTFHPQKEIVAYATKEGMVVVSDFNGNCFWKYKSIGTPILKHDSPIYSICFSKDGSEVWIVDRLGFGDIFISAVDAETGIENSANTFEDPFSGLSYGFTLSHSPTSVLIEFWAGDYGVEVWELNNTSSKMSHSVLFTGEYRIGQQCHGLLTFHPNENRFMAQEQNENLFYCYSWPDKSLIAKQRELTEEEEEKEDSCSSIYFAYLKNGMAIIKSELGRLHLFDPEKMERIEEIIIEGFEPMPINEIYRGLKEEELCLPTKSFERLGNLMVVTTDSNYSKVKGIIIFLEDDVIVQTR